MLSCQSQTVAVTRSQQFGFTIVSTVPEGAHGMNHKTRRQPETRSNACFTGQASADFFAGFQQFRACGTVDCTVYSSSAKQGFVGSIDDCVEFQGGDVCFQSRHPRGIICIHFFTIRPLFLPFSQDSIDRGKKFIVAESNRYRWHGRPGHRFLQKKFSPLQRPVFSPT